MFLSRPWPKSHHEQISFNIQRSKVRREKDKVMGLDLEGRGPNHPSIRSCSCPSCGSPKDFYIFLDVHGRAGTSNYQFKEIVCIQPEFLPTVREVKVHVQDILITPKLGLGKYRDVPFIDFYIGDFPVEEHHNSTILGYSPATEIRVNFDVQLEEEEHEQELGMDLVSHNDGEMYSTSTGSTIFIVEGVAGAGGVGGTKESPHHDDSEILPGDSIRSEGIMEKDEVVVTLPLASSPANHQEETSGQGVMDSMERSGDIGDKWSKVFPTIHSGPILNPFRTRTSPSMTGGSGSGSSNATLSEVQVVHTSGERGYETIDLEAEEDNTEVLVLDVVHLNTKPPAFQPGPTRVQPPPPFIPEKKSPTVLQPLINFLPETPEGIHSRNHFPTSGEYVWTVKDSLQMLASIISNTPDPDNFEDQESPPGLLIDLYDHQKYGLKYMSWREHVYPRGGILADEMGLGKTIMIISLILQGKALGRTMDSNDENSSSSSAGKKQVPSKSTLIVAPASVLYQWEKEIQTKSQGLKYLIYHGPQRPTSASLISKYHVVLTTYRTLGIEIPTPKKDDERYESQGQSPLVRIFWERLVLDEGHVIRNAKTLGANAACRINANHRWVVTGTPVHNSPGNMYSLVKFLRLKPFSDKSVWKHWIGVKLDKMSTANQTRLGTIAKALILRRTKDEVHARGVHVPAIPPKTVVDIAIDLSPEEKVIYDHVENFAKELVQNYLDEKEKAAQLQYAADNFVSAGPHGGPKTSSEGQNSMSHIFTMLLRLRQVSVHPYLIMTMLEDEDIDPNESYDPLNMDDVISRKNPAFQDDYKSAKLIRMYKDLRELRKSCEQDGRPMEKVVIVSQWTSLLDLVRKYLNRKGYSHCTISGAVKITDRADILTEFNTDPRKPQIMLLSLSAGGVGLNLVGANHLYFLDLHWNPQLELQAQDRVHRFGQTKPVTIHRYYSKNTMEERVMELQTRKVELANGILSSTKTRAGGGNGLDINQIRELLDV